MFDLIASFFRQNWYWLLIFAAMSALVFFLLRLQVMLREQMARNIQILLAKNPRLCLERLENNRRLRWLYRKPVLLLWKLDCYMALGEDGQARKTIGMLRNSKLEPMDKVELYQKEISFFCVSGDGSSAKKAFADLNTFLKEAGADKDKHYASILEEAEIIIGVYVDHNTGLIKKLTGRAEHTKNDVMRGIIQFRIAKLAWFKGDLDLMNTYLTRAEKNLRNTHYEPVIAAAKADPSILEIK